MKRTLSLIMVLALLAASAVLPALAEGADGSVDQISSATQQSGQPGTGGHPEMPGNGRMPGNGQTGRKNRNTCRKQKHRNRQLAARKHEKRLGQKHDTDGGVQEWK